MMRRDMNRWLDEHRLKVIACILATGVAWGVMTAAVSGKADVADVRSLQVEMMTQRRLLCRVPEVSQDSACDERFSR